MSQVSFRVGLIMLILVGTHWLSSSERVAAQPEPASPEPASPEPASSVLVTVDGTPIQQAELELQWMMRQTPAQDRGRYRRAVIEQLIDQQLVRVYLKRYGTKVDPRLVERQVVRIKDLIRRRDGDATKVLKTLGLDEAGLNRALSLPLAWQTHMRATITSEQLRDYFAQHRSEFDGTRVRAAQILIPAKTAEQRAAALKQLADIRAQVQDGPLTFERAVALYSQAPSRDEQGDIGYFSFRGKMPQSFTRHAFPLKVGQMSQPFASTFGVHLCRVTDRKPGTLSLEDVRSVVFKRLSDQVWKQLVARLRLKATIKRDASPAE